MAVTSQDIHPIIYERKSMWLSFVGPTYSGKMHELLGLTWILKTEYMYAVQLGLHGLLRLFCPDTYRISSVIRRSFSFQNNPKI